MKNQWEMFDEAKDSAGNEWTIWSKHWRTLGGREAEVWVLVYSKTGEVKVFPAEQLTKVEEEKQ